MKDVCVRRSPEQITEAVPWAASDQKPNSLLLSKFRQVGISKQIFLRWKKQYACLESNQLRELTVYLDVGYADNSHAPKCLHAELKICNILRIACSRTEASRLPIVA
jgi:hypothetical protein